MTADEKLNEVVGEWIEEATNAGYSFEDLDATRAAWEEDGSVPPELDVLFRLVVKLLMAGDDETVGQTHDWQVRPLLLMKTLIAAHRLSCGLRADVSPAK